MDRKEILTATLIAFFDTMKLNINEKEYKIALDLGISNSDFSEYADKLHKKEVVNIYNDLAVKFDNQNLSDYLFYYIFFKNKWISPSKLILKTFPEYRERIIYAFNTLIQLFSSKENMEFMENEIKKVWHKIKEEDDRTQSAFMESFYRLMKDEALLYIKKAIDNLPKIHVDFTTYDFDKTSNNHKIDSNLLYMLSGFKHTELFPDAVQLIFMYLEKNTENPMDFYFIFKEEIGIDKNSFNMNYEPENILLLQIINYYEEKKTIEVAYCLLFYLSKCLEFIYSVTESDYSNQYLFQTFRIVCCDSSIELRRKSIEMLSKLYLVPELQKKVIKLLMIYPANYLDNDNVEVIRNDCIAFDKYFSDIFDYNNFNECILMNHFYQVCKSNSGGNFSKFLNYIRNKTFTLYISIKKEKYKRNRIYEESEKKRLQKITKLGLKMKVDDFTELFDALQNDTIDAEYDCDISTGVAFLINSIANEPDKFIKVVREYLRNNTPFLLRTEIEGIIEKMMNLVGYIETKKIINMYDYQKKNLWIVSSYNLIPKEEISSRICDEIVKHLIDQKESESVFTITLYNAFRINNSQRDFVIRYIEAINKTFNKRPWVSAQLLNNHIGGNKEESYKSLINIFLEKNDILQEAYLLALDGREYFDYEGKFFLGLVSQEMNFIDKVVCKITDNNLGHDRNVLGTLWKASNYEELITFTVDSIGQYCKYSFSAKNITIGLFSSGNKNENLISKQEKWIMNYIDINYSNEDVIDNIFEIIRNFSEERRRNMLLYFCKRNSSFKAFEKIPLFPTSSSWEGSEVPIIENKITFIEHIKNELVGINYIEHRAYLDERILKLQQYKEKVLLSEFLKK